MQKELKDQIIKVVQDNIDEFQLVNFTMNKFRDYIFTSDGSEYLIGGEEVLKFISNFIKIYE